MTTYTAIADSEIDPESPGTTTLFTKLRDNPIAITEGDASAPLISGKALSPWPGIGGFGDESAGALTYSTNTNIARGVYQCSSLTIDSGVTLGCTDSTDAYFMFFVTGTATIAGTIDLAGKGSDGAGYLGGAGGGGGSDISYSGESGNNGFYGVETPGGTGGASGAANNGANGSNANADMVELLSLYGPGLPYAGTGISGGGKGGRGGIGTGTGDGTKGGGFVIIVANDINFTGTINCSGANAITNGQGEGHGGGGGGAKIFLAKTYTANTGAVDVTGGSGGVGSDSSGGDGGTGINLSLLAS